MRLPIFYTILMAVMAVSCEGEKEQSDLPQQSTKPEAEVQDESKLDFMDGKIESFLNLVKNKDLVAGKTLISELETITSETDEDKYDGFKFTSSSGGTKLTATFQGSDDTLKQITYLLIFPTEDRVKDVENHYKEMLSDAFGEDYSFRMMFQTNFHYQWKMDDAEFHFDDNEKGRFYMWYGIR